MAIVSDKQTRLDMPSDPRLLVRACRELEGKMYSQGFVSSRFTIMDDPADGKRYVFGEHWREKQGSFPEFELDAFKSRPTDIRMQLETAVLIVDQTTIQVRKEKLQRQLAAIEEAA